MASASTSTSTSAETGTEWNRELVKKSNLLKFIHNRRTRLTVVLLVLSFVMLISVAGLFAVAIYLDLHPRLPYIVVESASISDLSMRIDEASGMPYVSAFMSLTMVSRSRYRIPYRFSASNLSLVFEEIQPVGKVHTPTFYQDKQQNATFVATVLQKTFVGSQFVADLRNAIDAGRVRLRLFGHIPAKFRASKARMGSLQAPVNCTLDVRPAQPLVPTNTNTNTSSAVNATSASSSRPSYGSSSLHSCTKYKHCSNHAVVQRQAEASLLYADCEEFE